jgi:hypothetical protein
VKSCDSCGAGASDAAIKCRTCGGWLVATAAPDTAPPGDAATETTTVNALAHPVPAPQRQTQDVSGNPPHGLSAEPETRSWAPPDDVMVKITTVAARAWWREPSMSLVATAAGFVLVLAAAFALPWMHIGNTIVHFDLSYKQMQDALSARDLFSRMALDLGPLIVVVDLLVVGWSLAARGRIGIEAVTAPIGLACLTMYVTFQIHGYIGTVNSSDLGTTFGLHASTGWGPWICLLGCACLIVGALTGTLSTPATTATTYQPA